MTNYWILLILPAIAIGLTIKWSTDKSKNFADIIETDLKKYGLKYLSSTYPGLFKVGPFKKFEITIGKPMINSGTVQYEHTYYRIVELRTNLGEVKNEGWEIELRTKNNREERIWAKIETNWFKDTKIEYKPSLSELKK